MHALKGLIAVLLLCLVASPWSGDVVRAAAADTVVTIDGDTYSAAVVRSWWQNWNEKGMKVPETPDPFIDWQLFVHEAERMALFDNGQYQHDVSVYRKVISLVTLKNDEIDSKIDYSDTKLWQYYQENFSPRWLLNILIFKDQQSAEMTRTDLLAGKVTMAELVKIAGPRAQEEQVSKPHGSQTIDVEVLKKLAGAGEKLLGVHENVAKVPFNTEKGWRNIITGLHKGEYSQPFSWQTSFVVLNLVDTIPGDKEDFAKKKSDIQTRYRKYKEAVLTNDLVERLKKKFGVKVDEERLSKLDPYAPPDKFSDTPVITFSTMTVSEKQLMEKVQQDIDFNKQYGFKPESNAAILKRVVEGVISQTLITMESLDRHYETKSPTKELFEFYKHNKLVQRLEEQIRSEVKGAGEQEIAAFYQKHLADFTSPQIYRMAVIEGPEEVLKKIWLEVEVNNKDIMTVAEERLGKKADVLSYPANHLAPEVKAKADTLAKGDLSQVFASGKGYEMLYMVDSIPAKTAPLADIKDKIAQKLRQDEYEKARADYVQALRGKAKIEINDKSWKKLREELVKEYEKK